MLLPPLLWNVRRSRQTRVGEKKGCLVNAHGTDRGFRFVDLDEDGDDDLVYSSDREFWIRLYEGPAKGWSKVVLEGKAGSSDALPPIVRQGRINGVWFHSGAMILANEFTFGQPDLMERRPFQELLSRWVRSDSVSALKTGAW